jgi:branched-chain amino acid transport system ATP-binding protein
VTERPFLEVEKLTVQFGGIRALSEVSFTSERGELLAIIGPTGAGKSSLFNALTGVYPADGEIVFDGTPVVGKRPATVARLGIARTFQNLGLFEPLSVLDNLLIGRHVLMRGGVVAGALWVGRAKREDRAARTHCHELLDLLDLRPYKDQPVRTLPYGVKKRVDLGRALAAEPSLLLLDEPVAGMNSDESRAISELVVRLWESMSLTILLVEHDMPVVMSIAQKVLVLDFGKVIGYGTPDEIKRNPRVIEAYLGGGGDTGSSVVERSLQGTPT